MALAVFLAMVVLSAALAVISGRTPLTEASTGPAARASDPLLRDHASFPYARAAAGAAHRRGGARRSHRRCRPGCCAWRRVRSSLQEAGGNTVKQQEALGSVQRVRLSGLSAGYALFWFTAVQIAAKRGTPRIWWSLLLAGIALDIVVSFNRNMWIGTIIGLVLMAIVRFDGSSRLATGVAVALARLTLFIVFGSSSTSNHVVEPIIQRGETLINPAKTSKESSLEERAKETSEAWATAQNISCWGWGRERPSASSPLCRSAAEASPSALQRYRSCSCTTSTSTCC